MRGAGSGGLAGIGAVNGGMGAGDEVAAGMTDGAGAGARVFFSISRRSNSLIVFRGLGSAGGSFCGTAEDLAFKERAAAVVAGSVFGDGIAGVTVPSFTTGAWGVRFDQSLFSGAVGCWAAGFGAVAGVFVLKVEGDALSDGVARNVSDMILGPGTASVPVEFWFAPAAAEAGVAIAAVVTSNLLGGV